MKKLMIMVGVAAMAAGAFADVSFGYQGTLCDASGAAVESQTRKIAFRLYDSSTAATAEALWGRVYSVQTGANGVFNVELSDTQGTALADVPSTGLRDVIATCAKDTKPLYIGLLVENSSGEIAPRQKMIATPYSTFALDVDAASGDFAVTGILKVNGGIEMATNAYMTAGNVTAVQLTASGNATVDGTLIAKQSAESQGDLKVGGKLDVTGATALNGGATVGGNLAVSGTITDKGGEVGVPIGTIVMWSGSSNFLPPGWRVCNGEGTYIDQYSGETRQIPDLSGRFIVGVGAMTDAEGNKETYSLGQHDGGLNKHQLTTDEMPAHRHHYVSDDGLNGLNDTYAHCTAANKYKMDFDSTDNKGYKLGDYQNESVGKSQAHENRPPYYALYYIIKVQ